MKLYDLHCDTLTECVKLSQNLDTNNLSVSAERAEKFESYNQLCAIWFPNNIKNDTEWHYYTLHRDFFYNQIYKFSNKFIQIKDNNDIKKAISESKIGLMLTIEDGNILGKGLNCAKILAKDGVKVITLTWNNENILGFGVDENKGLKPLGKKTIPILEQNGIIIDVSHLSEKGFYDVAEIARKPFIASHSNAYSVHNHKRNLTDDQISIIKLNKGIIGINFYKEHLTNDEAKISHIIKHIEHILSLGGENVVCIGSDFDGCDTLDEIKTVDRTAILCENMKKCGYSDSLIEKIMFKNAADFFERNLL